METEVKGGSDYLQLAFDIRAKLEETCELQVTLYFHDGVKGDQLYSKDVFTQPFERIVRLQPLPEKSMFKVVAILLNGEQKIKNTIYTFTKSKITEQDEANEQIEQVPRMSSALNYIRSRQLPQRTETFERPVRQATSAYKQKKFEQPYSISTTEDMMFTLGKIHKIQGTKKLQKTILAARKAKNADQFMRPEKGLRPETRDERFQRTMLVSHGIQFFNEVYSYKEGNKMFQNDWFMGPFYSYDANQKQIRKK